MDDKIGELINRLDTDDLHDLRRASREILSIGPAALPALIEAMIAGEPRVRRSVAYLLGNFKANPESLDILCRVVGSDSEPKVRKNAAVSLGKIGSERTIEALACAAGREEVLWVRPSYALALGAIGGDQALTAIQNLVPQGDVEQEAINKALDRCIDRSGLVSWKNETLRLPLRLMVPSGLEGIVSEELIEKGFGKARVEAPGLLIPSPGIAPWAFLPAMRCIDRIVIDASNGRGRSEESGRNLSEHVAKMIRESKLLTDWTDWLYSETGRVRYRFSIEGRAVRRDVLRSVLESVRDPLEPLGWIDSPSHYDVELTAMDQAGSLRLFVSPSFMVDDRFTYRTKDVGASIRPAIGAGLARLTKCRPGGRVFDPTCGSGTLLIERAIADSDSRLIGWDISRTAVRAARENVEAASLSDRIEICEYDATKIDDWPVCDSVLANLPFGIRTRRESSDLKGLYSAILDGIALRLQPSGRAVLYTANRKLFEPLLSVRSGQLKIRDRLRIQAGGLWCSTLVVTKHR